MATFNGQVAASADDAQENSGTVTIDGIVINANASSQYLAFRIPSVTIPPGSTIDAATFTGYFMSGSFDDPDVTIYAQDADNAGQFAATSNNISDRPLTTASVAWSASGLGTGLKTSPDFKSVVQEVIDRPGWASGNAIVIIVKGNSSSSAIRLYTYDNGTGDGPSLAVTYTPDLSQELELPHVGPLAVAYPPTLAPGAVELELPHVGPLVTAYAPTLQDDSQAVELPHVGPLVTAYAPTLRRNYGDIQITNITHYEDEDINSASFPHETPDGENRVLVVIATYYDAIGVTLAKWGSVGSGDGQFNDPNGIAIDGAGNVYVVDTGNHRIQKFTSGGTFIAKWGSNGTGDGEFDDPHGIAVDASGNVYVADRGNHRIQKFNSSGTFLSKWGSNGTGDGQFNNPVGVAVGSAGNVYVSDYFNDRIQKFDSGGTFITKWGSNGTGDGEFSFPFGVAVDGVGNVYVADTDNNRIQKFDSSGTFLSKWGGSGSGDGQFFSPHGIAIDGAGNVYVADTINDRIQKFTAAFKPVAPYYGGVQLEVIQYVDSGAYFQGIYMLKTPPVGTQAVAFGPSGAPAILMMTALSLNIIEQALVDYTAAGASIGEGLGGTSTVLSTSHNRTYADDTLTLWSVLYEDADPAETLTPQTNNEIITTRNVGDLTYTMGLHYEATGETGSRTFGATAGGSVGRKSIVFVHLEQARTLALFMPHVPSTFQAFAPSLVARAELELPAVTGLVTAYAPSLDRQPGPMQYIRLPFVGMGSPQAFNVPHVGPLLTVYEPSLAAKNELELPFVESTMVIYAPTLQQHASTRTAGVYPLTLIREE